MVGCRINFSGLFFTIWLSVDSLAGSTTLSGHWVWIAFIEEVGQGLAVETILGLAKSSLVLLHEHSFTLVKQLATGKWFHIGIRRLIVDRQLLWFTVALICITHLVQLGCLPLPVDCLVVNILLVELETSL